MKLTNPTDDQLNACFAEKVAGWKMARQETYQNFIPRWFPPGTPDAANMLAFDTKPPAFTASADAVLPWLEKRGYSIIYRGGMYDVSVYDECGDNEAGRAYYASFPRAAVIALLRAHGVEVEFTP